VHSALVIINHRVEVIRPSRQNCRKLSIYISAVLEISHAHFFWL